MNKQSFKQMTLMSLTLLFSLGLVVMMVTGCADKGAAPQSNNLDATLEWLQGNIPATGPNAISGEDAEALLNDPYFVGDSKGSVVLGEDGGTIVLQLDNQDVTFSIPEGAAPAGTEIEIWGFKFATPAGEVFVYDCQPSGIQFTTPIRVDHPLRTPSGSVSGLFYLGDYSYFWELEDSDWNNTGYVTFKIHHFSKYGIS